MDMLDRIKNIEIPSKAIHIVKILSLLGVCVMVMASVRSKKSTNIQSVQVHLMNSDLVGLVDQVYVLDLIHEKFGQNLELVSVDLINTSHIEEYLMDNAYIDEAQVYLNSLNELNIKTRIRTPIVRIMDGVNQYYLDKKGDSVPLSKEYTARVPVLFLPSSDNTFLTEARRAEVVRLIEHINENSLCQSLVDQIILDAQNEYTIIPFVGNERIKLGGIEDIQDKINKIELFYKKKLVKGLWDHCSIIDVRFKGQVVCDLKTPEKT